jgi:hypothetical protein
MAVPTIIATPSASNANSFGTRAEADSYHDTQIHTDNPWPSNVSASVNVGSGTNGTVEITVDEPGTEGNSYSISVVAGVGLNVVLSAVLVGTVITVTLGTNGSGVLDSSKNTAILVAAAVNALTGISATASGSGAVVIPVKSLTYFSGGSYQEELKNPALIMATQWMVASIDWTGYVTSETQALPWPRSGMLKRNQISYVLDTEIPSELKACQFELARLLLYSDRTVESDVAAQGLMGLKAGPISLTFREYAPVLSVIPVNITNLLVPSWVNFTQGQLSSTRDLLRA